MLDEFTLTIKLPQVHLQRNLQRRRCRPSEPERVETREGIVVGRVEPGLLAIVS
jgi:hypothetical protein